MGRRRKGFRVLGPYDKKDGRYLVLVRGPGLEGGTDSKPFYFRSEAKALRAKREIEADLKRQLEMSLAEAVDLYLDGELRTERKLRESTIDEARARLNPLIRLAPDLISAVEPAHIKQRLAQLPSVASRKGTRARMNDFFNFAVEAKLVRTNPCDGIVVKGKADSAKVALTRVEARALDAHLWAEVKDGGADAEAASAVVLLLYFGLRVSELLRLQARDIDLMSGGAVLSVERQAKTKKGLRDMEVPQKVVTLLEGLTSDRNLTDWIWPSARARSGHRGKTWLLKATRRLCKKAGVTVVCPQGLRATHGRLARKAGETAHAIQAQLGHEDVRTSVESYIGEDVEAQERTRLAQMVLAGSKPPERG